MQKRSMGGTIVIILLIIYGIYRAYDASTRARVRQNLEEGRLYTDCSSCSTGIPLYSDIRPPVSIIARVPSGEECETSAWYESSVMKPTLESQYGGSFVDGVYYLVECPSGRGWIEAQFTTR